MQIRESSLDGNHIASAKELKLEPLYSDPLHFQIVGHLDHELLGPTDIVLCTALPGVNILHWFESDTCKILNSIKT